jgi:hypothetical protein
VELLCHPAGYIKHAGSVGGMRGTVVFFEDNSGATCQKFQRFGKTDLFVFLHKTDDIAMFPTGPAAIALPAGIDIERRTAIIVEGTQPLEGRALGLERQVTAHHLDDIVGLFHLLDPVVIQGSPVCRRFAPIGPPPSREESRRA